MSTTVNAPSKPSKSILITFAQFMFVPFLHHICIAFVEDMKVKKSCEQKSLKHIRVGFVSFQITFPLSPELHSHFNWSLSFVSGGSCSEGVLFVFIRSFSWYAELKVSDNKNWAISVEIVNGWCEIEFVGTTICRPDDRTLSPPKSNVKTRASDL